MTDAVPLGPDGKPLWYGRRRTHKLRPGRQRLVDALLPKLRVRIPDDGGSIDLAAAFDGVPSDLRLEVGFGAGEHLSGTARQAPDAAFIGCEPFINGVSALLADIEAHALTNIRIYDDDARILLDALPDACITTVYVLFPDPWPKLQHHRRRIVQRPFLDQLARIAKDGADFLFASDHMGYAAWALAEIMRHPDWSWTAEHPADWRVAPGDWVPTRYQAKAARKGHLPVYLKCRRRDRASSTA